MAGATEPLGDARGNDMTTDDWTMGDFAVRDPDLRRVPCPECPDGQVWDKNGPTNEVCPRCLGEAFIWSKL